MRVSVALATFNGASFIEEQLGSLATQSRLPDELVVCDDLSEDETLEIVQRFAEKNPAIAVQIFRNESRLGYAENFAEALSKCTGDIIFLCDQDDVWFREKIAVVLDAFEKHPDAWLVVNDADLTSASLERVGLTLCDQLRRLNLPLDQQLFGCCMGVRSAFVKTFLPVPSHLMGHDGWINLLSNTLAVRLQLNESLQFYRRHGKNASDWVTTDLRGASRFKLLLMQVRSQSSMSPSAATETRIAHFSALKSRLERDVHFLRQELSDESLITNALLEIDHGIALNSRRLSIQKMPVFMRLWYATAFAFTRGYRGFDGSKSWIRDVVG